ncbi:hypothetical protein GCM10027174_00930 [Salinifilum aidingensis]
MLQMHAHRGRRLYLPEQHAAPRGTPARSGPMPETKEGGPVAETYNGYCVKCREKRDFSGEVEETNGRRMAKGTCPVCGTKMTRILGKSS